MTVVSALIHLNFNFVVVDSLWQQLSNFLNTLRPLSPHLPACLATWNKTNTAAKYEAYVPVYVPVCVCVCVSLYLVVLLLNQCKARKQKLKIKNKNKKRVTNNEKRQQQNMQ